MARDIKWFNSLSIEDFDNGSVLDEIATVFKERDQLLKDIEQFNTEDKIRTGAAKAGITIGEAARTRKEPR